MARALALESFQSREFDVAGVARMLLEDLSSPAPAVLARPSEDIPAEPVIDPESPDYAAGEAAGREAASADAADALADAVTRAEAAEARVAALEPQLTGAIAAIEQTRHGAERRMAEDAAAIIGAAFEALLPEFARKGFAAEAAASVREWLSRAASAEGVLYVPEGFEGELGAAVAASAGPDATVSVKADVELQPGAARFEWRDGLGELDLNESADRIRAAFQAHVERLGLAAAVAAKALQPPVKLDPTPAQVEETAAEEQQDAPAAQQADIANAAQPDTAVKAPAKPRRKPAAQKAKSSASGDATQEAAPAKAPARTRKSKAASAKPDAKADAATEETVKKAPSRRRSAGAAKSAKVSSGDNDE